MPKGKGYGGKDVMGKSPGDVKEKPQVPTFRGDKGDSSAKGSDETKSVHYDR